jgi:glycosyltransferase involved in cell wall biosynthesis
MHSSNKSSNEKYHQLSRVPAAVKRKPLVSVMITSYNQRDDLLRAVQSVLDQTYDNIQIVIADDCSTKDDSQAIINDLAKRYEKRIKPVFQSENVGISKNKTAGFRACDGEYITYLDGDDYYFPEKIAAEVAVLNQFENAQIAYSNFNFSYNGRKKPKKWMINQESQEPKDLFERVITRNFPSNAVFRCEMYRRQILVDLVGYYDESLFAFEDWDLKIRATKIFKAGYSGVLGSAYVQHISSISKDPTKKQNVDAAFDSVLKKNLPLLDDLPLKYNIRIRSAIENYLIRRNVIRSRSIIGLVTFVMKEKKMLFNIGFLKSFLGNYIRNL